LVGLMQTKIDNGVLDCRPVMALSVYLFLIYEFDCPSGNEQKEKITGSVNRNILISHNWGNKPVVKQIYDETEYTHQTWKKIIPLKMESGYEADGWLEPMIGNNLQFDFSGNDPLEKTVNELIAVIQQELNRKNGVVVDVSKKR
ncbi:hypothetical protein AM593_08119, partial [Mytilus galloprovincialis]